MKKIKVVIEKTKDFYSAYAENVDGVTGGGETVSEAKKSILESIEIVKSLRNCPKILKGQYTLVYKFDIESLLHFYKGIFTNAAFEKLTGINQKQIQHYSSGYKKPRPAQARKIKTALQKLGSELISIEL
jgi:predicted RNase H-like HicB family nuclease